jgi:hypothetical protein
MSATTREKVDGAAVPCDDEASAPDALEGVDRRPLRVTVILIDQGTVVVDALDWF